MTQHSRNTPQFYLTAPSPCPYLPGQEERKVFTHLVGERAAELNDLSGELLAVALTDVLSDGLSMVYSFFDSDEASRSLGTFMILDHIARAREMRLPYVYLGYWVEGSRKMDYKGRFLPQQRLTPDGWKRVER